MVNKIGYRQYPLKIEFERLYLKQSFSQVQLAQFYGCNKKRIKAWIEFFGLQKRAKGGGNNHKFEHITKKILEGYLLENRSNNCIASLLGISNRSVTWLLSKHGLKRTFDKTEYQRYARKVRHLSEKNYVLFVNEINPNRYPRTLCGVAGGYQLDHIVSISDCFLSGVSIEECSAKNNLQMITWQENLNKRKK